MATSPHARADDEYPVLTEVVPAAAAPQTVPTRVPSPPKGLAAAANVVAAAAQGRLAANVVPTPLPRLQKTQPLEALYGEVPKRPLDAVHTSFDGRFEGGPKASLAQDPHLAPVSQHELELRESIRSQDALQLRDEIEGAILGDLSMRIEPLVEARLKEKLADLLEQVLAGMTAELKLTVRDIVREAVDQAVAQEWAARDKRLLAKK